MISQTSIPKMKLLQELDVVLYASLLFLSCMYCARLPFFLDADKPMREPQRRKPRRKEFTTVRMSMDGNCLFRALAYPWTDHVAVRKNVVKYVDKNWNRYKHFVVDVDHNDYIATMQCDSTWGDELMLAAFSELYNKRVIVHDASSLAELVRYGTSPHTIRVSFTGSHYDHISSIP